MEYVLGGKTRIVPSRRYRMTDQTRIAGTIVVAPLVTGTVVSIVNLAAGQPINPLVLLVVTMAFGLLYGLMTGLLFSYDLSQPLGVLALIIDLTWSLPNTIAGFILGNLLY